MNEIGKYYVIHGKDSDGDGFVCENILSIDKSDENSNSYWTLAESALDAMVFETVEEAKTALVEVENQKSFTELKVGCVSMMYSELGA